MCKVEGGGGVILVRSLKPPLKSYFQILVSCAVVNRSICMANTSSTCSEKHPFILNGNLSSVEICDGSWLSTPYRSSFFQSSDHNDGGHSLLPNHPPEVSNCPLQRSLCSYEVLGSVFVTSNVVGIDVVRVRNSKFEEQGYPCVRICIGVQCSLYKLITEEALSTESSGHNYSNTNS